MGGGEGGLESLAHSCLDDGAVCLWKIREYGLGKLRGAGVAFQVDSRAPKKGRKQEVPGQMPASCIQ